MDQRTRKRVEAQRQLLEAPFSIYAYANVRFIENIGEGVFITNADEVTLGYQAVVMDGETERQSIEGWTHNDAKPAAATIAQQLLEHMGHGGRYRMDFEYYLKDTNGRRGPAGSISYSCNAHYYEKDDGTIDWDKSAIEFNDGVVTQSLL